MTKRINKKDNPFYVPKGSKAFDIVAEEEKRKKEEKERLNREGAAAVPQRYKRVSRRELTGDPITLHPVPDNPPIFRIREPREPMRDFIQKKREMFIVGMLIKEKEEEISKMNLQCQKEEEKLKKEFQQLEEQKQNHDRAVRQSHQDTQEASHRAGLEAEEQQKMKQELKRLDQQIAKTQADLDKVKDKEQEYREFKLFLDRLIEPDILEIRLETEQKKEQERQQKHLDILRQIEELERKLKLFQQGLTLSIDDEEAAANAAVDMTEPAKPGKPGDGAGVSWAVTGGAPTYQPDDAIPEENPEETREQVIANLQAQIAALKKKADRALIVTPQEEQEWMFFNDPDKIQEVLSKLKDDNLFLTQMRQDEEVLLEQSQQRQQTENERLQERIDEITLHSEELDELIAKEEAKLMQLNSTINTRGISRDAMSEETKLAEKIHQIYTDLKCDDHGYSVQNTILILGAIEKHLLFLLRTVESLNQIDSEMVQALLKKKTQLRFAANRAAQTAELERKNHERNEAALKRSTGPTVKKVGRPEMFRSAKPKVHKKTVQVEKKMTEEEQEDEVWLEKYRPKNLDDVVGNQAAIDRLKVCIRDGTIPNIILSGPPGTGKTTCVLCIARTLLGDQYKEAVLELNASDERGIDVVRNKIKMFAQKKVTLPAGRPKIIILDEVDSMTDGAQQALRRIMEIYSGTTRFALACNNSSQVIEPIQSRCAILRFTRLSDKDILKRLCVVAEAEKVPADNAGMGALIFTAQGDMRQAINNMQSTFYGFGKIDAESVFKVCDQPHPEIVKKIVEHCIDGQINQALELSNFLLGKGYSGLDVVSTLFYLIPRLGIEEEVKFCLIREVSEAQLVLLDGAEDSVQLSGLLARMCAIALSPQKFSSDRMPLEE
ncbi:putative Replication factor C subunit 2 [Blattamonas nauphoetae]|uniref:Replication factor C subunit 2 n=1 Tax=Blattamonas nauphoetae TaxID=2049346 RepID=A0ABQ9YEQ1_9EUKA|nr:putative Replication factor C subunit 2 [Blattamonas nauphoetae]